MRSDALQYVQWHIDDQGTVQLFAVIDQQDTLLVDAALLM
jgi:hypothetical protein